mmetsp:Transcript_2492/g.7487  ORF Transcript_2492/g.7487 Transcript_2492/m.7487 type:complete len:361 (+) Transcript_2492:164-1246(+)
MADPAAVPAAEAEDELVDYEEDVDGGDADADKAVQAKSTKGSYVGIHSSGFKDFLLKPELLRAIVDCGFEHPSEVQHECIPQAILGMDVLCQAKSGMGKTAVFVLSVLQQIEPTTPAEVGAIVLCHTRELAYQICHEFERFSVYMTSVKVANFYGGIPIKQNKEQLESDPPHVVVGTPGRIKQLGKTGELKLGSVRHFILDECDKMLDKLDMRGDVQDIFKMTPHDKQVMMFSATLSKEIRPICKKFMSDVSAELPRSCPPWRHQTSPLGGVPTASLQPVAASCRGSVPATRHFSLGPPLVALPLLVQRMQCSIMWRAGPEGTQTAFLRSLPSAIPPAREGWPQRSRPRWALQGLAAACA